MQLGQACLKHQKNPWETFSFILHFIYKFYKHDYVRLHVTAEKLRQEIWDCL